MNVIMIWLYVLLPQQPTILVVNLNIALFSGPTKIAENNDAGFAVILFYQIKKKA